MIEEVFGPSGLLAEKFAGYAPRKGQLDMAELVTKAIAEKGHALIEGPTGTGKSLAYLVPAIDYVVKQKAAGKPGARVIIVTANIALQEQLVEKDLPLLASILPSPFKFALSKGKNNYLCVDSLGKALVEHQAKGLHLPMVNNNALEQVLAWAQTTKTGDVSEFADTIPPALWRRLAVGSDECKGSSCKWFENCFAEKASRAARGADVIVTNYHMFFAHLVVRAKMKEIAAGGADVAIDVVLPPADIVIFDEGHKAADIARDFLGFQLTKGSIDWLVKGFKHELGDKTAAASARFFDQLAAHKKDWRAYKARLKKTHPLTPIMTELGDLLGKVAKFYKDSLTAAAWSREEEAELEMRARRAFTLAKNVKDARDLEGDGKIVYFIEETTGGGALLKSKPIDVAPFLSVELFGDFKTTVVTSATLATGNNSFDFIRKELGAPPCDELVAESPFSWGNQVLFVVPDDMVDPSDRDNFPHSVADHVKQIVTQAAGRTLGLFTSYKNLDIAYRACQMLPFNILKQGDAPRMKLVERFKAETTSVLLGCESFWAGVDVPGESCSCVVIDRLPFPNPDDAIFDAISERDKNAFFTYAVPRAVIAFKQGFGRLIRTTKDRGVVVLLDRRIMSKGYGRSFIAALPPVMMSDDVTDIGKFFAKEVAA